MVSIAYGREKKLMFCNHNYDCNYDGTERFYNNIMNCINKVITLQRNDFCIMLCIISFVYTYMYKRT